MELPIFLREHFNGMYRTDVYFICKQLAEFPIFLIIPILYAAIIYFMVGLNPLFMRYVTSFRTDRTPILNFSLSQVPHLPLGVRAGGPGGHQLWLLHLLLGQ